MKKTRKKINKSVAQKKRKRGDGLTLTKLTKLVKSHDRQMVKSFRDGIRKL